MWRAGCSSSSRPCAFRTWSAPPRTPWRANVALRDLVSFASEQFIAYRTQEGAVLEADFRQRVGTIEALRR